jgi:L-aspartate oxidase
MADEKNRTTGAPQAAAPAGGKAPNGLDCDVVIVGCGVSGLYAAYNLPRALRIVMLSKEDVATCDSMLAQGGICVMRDRDDYDSWFEDTMRAGHYENRAQSVDTMIWNSRDVIFELMRLGVRFDRTPQGGLDYTREGAHSRPRIVHHEDVTGREITTHLLAQVRQLPNVTILENTVMDDLLVEGSACAGVHAVRPDGTGLSLRARDTILCTGGIGGTYEHSTNFRCLTGDGCRIAAAHGVELEHMDYVQIHPTTLYTTKPGRSFLLSESCRGEGAILLDNSGKRFCDELQPRDIVSQNILAKMREEGSRHVWLSFQNVPRDVVTGHFHHIYETCLEEGYDILREPAPVVPAQHYLMGGIHVDQNSKTTMDHLYAAGETSCNGVHGKNRLASNSLLESMVFARLAARDIVRGRHAQWIQSR